jgi:hypothetical protein
MSHTSGTATSYTDLLDRLDQFLINTGHAWGKKFTGTGTGNLTAYNGTATSVAETWTLTAINATTFSVSGSVSGAQANATVGTPYTAARIAFTITAGGTAYVAGDVWTINTSPKWLRLRRAGCAGQEKRTTNLANEANLYDGSTATRAARAATTAFIEYEMIAPTEVREFVLQAYLTANSPAAFSLDWKDNAGDSWTTAQSWSGQTWSDNQTRVYTLTTAPGAHRFWRFNITASTGSTLEFSTFNLREQVNQLYTLHERAEYVWSAPGLGGTSTIYVGAETYGSVDFDTYNFGLTGFRTWNSTLPAAAQANPTSMRYLSLVNASISYWIVANGQRFILVTKNNSVYQIAYAGFGLPYEPPSAHAYPMIVGATSSGRTVRYSDQNAYFRFPIDPGRYGLAAMFPDAQWRDFSNRFSGTGEGVADTVVAAHVYPTFLTQAGLQLTFYRSGVDDTTRLLMPCVLGNMLAAPYHIWGEFEGLYWTPGYSVASESLIQESRFDHLVVQNVFRVAAQNYGAVRLD